MIDDKPKTIAELYSRPGTWTKGKLARNSDGIVCNGTDGGAVCWCMVGAIELIYPNKSTAAMRLLKDAAMRLGIARTREIHGKPYFQTALTNDALPDQEAALRWAQEAGV